MGNSNKQKVIQLTRRRDHLIKRVAASEGRDLTYDKQEISALNFALECIEKCEKLKALEKENLTKEDA